MSVHQRGVVTFIVLFILVVLGGTAVHEISIGHSPFGDKTDPSDP